MSDLITGDFPCPFCGSALNKLPSGKLVCRECMEFILHSRSLSAAIAVCEAAGYEVYPSSSFGCHVDLEPGQEPDECVLTGEGMSRSDCVYARDIERPSQCRYWKPKEAK